MRNIQKRLQEIELELKELYSRALEIKDEMIDGKSGWFWLEACYSGISNIARERASDCKTEFKSFQKRNPAQYSPTFELAKSLILNSPWEFGPGGLGVRCYYFGDFRMILYLNHLLVGFGEPKIKITYKGEFIKMEDLEEEKLYEIWAESRRVIVSKR